MASNKSLSKCPKFLSCPDCHWPWLLASVRVELAQEKETHYTFVETCSSCQKEFDIESSTGRITVKSKKK